MISQTPFVIVDLETTGLEPRLDNIIEIAAVKMVNGKIVDEWDTLINPGIFVPQITTDITGITTDMLKDSPTFADVVEEYIMFLGDDSVFVAHNVDFDHEFIQQHMRKLEMEELKHPYLCTFKLAKRVHPNLSKYGLGSLCETFEIDLAQAHRALHDARATAHLFDKFMRVLQDGGLKRLRDIPGIQNLPKEVKAIGEGQVSLF